ncbi:MAG: SUMF1/EgtB/PvdO family nonheme iron enzyme, partial [Planctomycetota bacterium]|nr:SUMF1/EgtB/PvdO family nonheme iron enzyme [Planctomycetota bacterium]MEE2990570.1 SUMF1/EgtB/PvdO family nonheme iron enzyme [Planctomycetota bacterium]
MPISVTCPDCSSTFELRDELAGKKTRCSCGTVIAIPDSQVDSSPLPADIGPVQPAHDPLAAGPTSDPLLGSSRLLASNHWSSSPSTQPRQRYADTEDQGVPGWILPLFGGVLAIILLGGIMILSQGNDNETPPDDDLATAPSEPATDPGLPTEVVPPEIPPQTIPPAGGNSSSLTNSIGMQLVEIISQGSRMMGTNEPDGEAFRDEKPSHSVNLLRRFKAGMHEVTQAQFAEIMGENPSTFTGDKLPVNNVSWHQAVEFCQKLSLRKEEFDAKRAYRLPTEAEWEYMARWGTKTVYHFGDDPANLDAHAWYNANSNKATQPVGQKNPNPLGLHDMLGNVSEWCSDWYSSDYYVVSSSEMPLGPSEGKVKVLRGGSWAG